MDWEIYLLSFVDANSHETMFEYDPLNRLKSEINALGKRVDYEYDFAGNMIKKTKPDNSEMTYDYDEKNRLTAVNYPDGTERSFSYDAAGNMTILENDGAREIREFDAMVRLVESTNTTYDETMLFEYDSLGNRLTAFIDPERRTTFF